MDKPGNAAKELKLVLMNMQGRYTPEDVDELEEAAWKVVSAIEEADAVEAVPLEPLCKWLAGYAAPPQYALKEVITGYQIQPNLPILSVNYRVEAWKLHFMELLKSGLMDTEGEDEKEET